MQTSPVEMIHAPYEWHKRKNIRSRKPSKRSVLKRNGKQKTREKAQPEKPNSFTGLAGLSTLREAAVSDLVESANNQKRPATLATPSLPLWALQVNGNETVHLHTLAAQAALQPLTLVTTKWTGMNAPNTFTAK